MEQQLTIGIGKFFTDTRVRICQAECANRDCDMQCQLKEVTIGKMGDCDQYHEEIKEH